jgi:hypothetical protein
MTFGLRGLLAISVLLLSSFLAGATKPAAPNGTFDVFVALDQQLTVLDQQLQQARGSLGEAAAMNGRDQREGSRPWAAVARNMQPTVAAILRNSYRLEHTYRRREVRLHRSLFRRLYKRARLLRGDVRLLSEARTSRWAKVVQTRLSKALVAYIFDFQLVSGGYAALRCQAAQLACCEPVRKDPHGPFSCKWECLQLSSSCHSGFPGPQIGPSYEQPLSASR